MSATQSNLSTYGYDLVTGTTQLSINATMKQFLAAYDGEDYIMCYGYDPNNTNNIIELDYNQLVQDTGVDPFSVPNDATNNPNDTEHYNANLQPLYDAYFAFAFKAKTGLPLDYFPVSDIPDTIILDKGNSIVSYNLVYEEFEIVNLNEVHGTVSYVNLNQSDQPAPWVFNFNVNLALQGNESAFDDLDDSVKQQVENLCPDSMFSVQQLYLDLNTAGLDTQPEIVGLDPSSMAYGYLNSIFLGQYFTDLQNSGGAPMLGYAIQPTEPVTSPSIIPTSLNFVVSPYLDAQGLPVGVSGDPSSYDLYTLNWLVMSDSHVMPAAVPFDWNWVDQVNSQDYSGTMSIKRDVFVDFINQLLSPSLSDVCIIPSVDVDISGIKMDFKWGLTHDNGPHSYTPVNDGTTKVLTFYYSASDSDSDWSILGTWGNMTLTTSVQSDIYFQGSQIKTVTTCACFAHINVEGGVSEGDIVKYKCTTNYDIGVDSLGNLSVTQEEPIFVDQSDFDPSGWSEFVTLGTLNNLIAGLEDYWSCMEDFMAGENDDILAMLNGSSAWVFPGGETFSFKNVSFSQYLDLVSDVTYVSPS